MTLPIEKLRDIAHWSNYQNEGFNFKFKSISDIEKAFDYCVENDIEFLDDLSFFDREERLKIEKELTEILGYSVF